MKLLFNTLKSKRYPITKKIEKIKWKELKDNLTQAKITLSYSSPFTPCSVEYSASGYKKLIADIYCP